MPSGLPGEVGSLAGHERLDPCDSPSKDQSMDVMSTFIGVHRLQVHDMPDHVILIRNPIPPKHVSGLASNVQGLPTVIPLQQRDHFRGGLVLILQAAELQAGMEAQRDLGEHVCQLFLNQLVLGQWDTKLDPVQSVLPGRVQTELSSSKHTPCDAIAGIV